MKINENDRVILAKLDRGEYWSVVTNPRYCHCETAMSNLLLNQANDYAEYKNCGVMYRMVRFKDVNKYGVKHDSVKFEHVLPQLPPEGEKNTKEALQDDTQHLLS